MGAWNSSSLAASDTDHNSMRNGSGLLKNLPTRISKQHITEQKMFGSKRGKTGKGLQIGKKFKKQGKGIMKGSTSAHMKGGGISPSLPEFDKMMSSIVGAKGSKGPKKSFFNRKQFG